MKRIHYNLAFLLFGLFVIYLAQNGVTVGNLNFLKKQNSQKQKSGEFDYYTLVLSWSPTPKIAYHQEKNSFLKV